MGIRPLDKSREAFDRGDAREQWIEGDRSGRRRTMSRFRTTFFPHAPSTVAYFLYLLFFLGRSNSNTEEIETAAASGRPLVCVGA